MSTDKRVLKTRTSIKNALMELSLEKDISKISVSDIAEKAFINRSTFYLHYSDVRAVANDIEEMCAEKISAYMCAFDINDLYVSVFSLFSNLTNDLDQDIPLKKYIIESKNSHYIAERLKIIFAEKTIEALSLSLPDIDRNNAIYPISFIAGGIIDCYLKWERSHGDVPLERLIAQLSEIVQAVIDKIK